MSDNYLFESWGRYPKVSHLGELVPQSNSLVKGLVESSDSSVLPRGLGRSYGDSCLNENGYLVSTRYLNRFQNFDPATGILRCESGVTLDEILRVFVPRGWFLPVTPGTKFVTIGGAIANDIHGKNHHKAGTFCNNVLQFELLRSDGTSVTCSEESNKEWFRVTIGGLGLTGMILWAEIKLIPIQGPYIEMDSIKFNSFDEFFEISKESGRDFEYTVSWLDCIYAGDEIRGIFMRGNHSSREESNREKAVHKNAGWKTFPFDAPSFLLSTTTVKLFNHFYYNKQKEKEKSSNVHYDPFFYPLDGLNNWNRMYGNRGFLQWQCVVPFTEKNDAIKMIVSRIKRSGLGSFLVVLKEFGDIPALGMLSFPMPGITLAVDFPNVGEKLYSLLDEIDAIVVESRGRLYPAKDSRMSAGTFRSSFPEIDNFSKYVDQKFSSSFYRRVGGIK